MTQFDTQKRCSQSDHEMDIPMGIYKGDLAEEEDCGWKKIARI